MVILDDQDVDYDPVRHTFNDFLLHIDSQMTYCDIPFVVLEV